MLKNQRHTIFVIFLAHNRKNSDYYTIFTHNMFAFTNLIQQYSEAPLTRQIILSLLKEYKRPNDKIAELIKFGYLTSVKKGLYLPGSKLNVLPPELFLVANHLWGPSYISLEAALSHWGFIPERVHEITSVTTKSSKTYKTEVGRFSYRHSSLPYYAMGIKSISLSKKQVVLIASPEKAICDKIVMTSGIVLRSSNQVIQFLTEDMRIDEDMLLQLNLKEISSWIKHAPKSSSLKMLTNTLQNL